MMTAVDDQLSPSQQFNCQLCTAPDSDDNMVQCDTCNKWFHYKCAQVDSSVQNCDWACKNCAPQAPAPAVMENSSRRASVSSKPSKSARNSPAKRLQFDMQRLEEERALKEKRDQEYLKQKYLLLSQMEEASEDDDDDHANSHDSQKQVQEWLKDARNSTVSTKQPINFPGKSNVNSSWMGAIVGHPQAHRQLRPDQSNNVGPPSTSQVIVVPSPQPAMNSVNQIESHQKPNTEPLLLSQFQQPPINATISCDQQQNQRSQNIQMCYPAEIRSSSTSGRTASHEVHTLTRGNLAARQSFSRDLHTFSGSPEEWPLFISNFNRSTELCGFSAEENLIRLQRALKGKALDAVRSMLIQPECVPRVISTLKMLFGRPELIIYSLLQKIHGTPSPKAEKLETLVAFAVAVQNICATMEASGLTTHLSNPTLLHELAEKLPPSIRLNWAIYKQTLPDCTLSHFSAWLYQIAEAANCIIIPNATATENKQSIRSTKERGFINTHTDASDSPRKSIPGFETMEGNCLICGGMCYCVAKCKKFEQLSHSCKWAAVREHKLCRRCLKRHGSYRCKSDAVCGKNNCSFKHHRLLHNDQKDSVANQQQFTGQHNAHPPNLPTATFRVVPVTLYGNGVHIKSFAFLDEGSSLTLMDEGLAKELKVEGTPEPLCLRWTADTHRKENDSKVMSIRISGTSKDNKTYHLSNVHTVRSLQLPIQSVDAKELQVKFKHLRDLPIESYVNASPRLLIGLNNWKLGLPIKYREGNADAPVATKTRLGWVVHGCFSSPPQNYGSAGSHENYHICECDKRDDSELQNLVKEFICSEKFGASKNESILLPTEEKRALELLQNLTHRKNNRFETGLLWRYDSVHLPDSLPMAKRRLTSLQKRMQREPQMASALHKQIEEYIAKGYTRKLTKNELEESRPCWYLPVFPVVNANKPGKIRMVWDAAAKVDGISLNSLLLKGPDQLVSLTSVIYKFRERHIAICGDIREMFHQIRIREEDQHYQRFLWIGRKQNEIDVYVMRVMTFGSTCSPCCAHYVLNRNAADFEKEYPRAVRSIRENHYVDDLMDSVDSEEEAIKLARQIRFIHRQGGFCIRNWMSNSRAVINALHSNQIEEISLTSKTELGTEKVLGMWWCTASDFFTYKLSPNIRNTAVLSGEARPTKREVLRILMTIFDPLGLLANFLMYVKILLQEIWRTGIAWDEKIHNAQYDKWLNWVRFLPQVVNLQVPRCYVSNKFIHQPVRHLHIFVDASENGFAAAGYIRSSDGEFVDCALVGAKTRVAPLKILSIPRLELQAAVLGARLAKSIVESHSIKFQQQFFWTDSKTVLSWLHSDHRRYRQFVGFRVSEILDLTSPADWRWIPSELNVADEATKWTKNPDFSASNRWFKGPAFLTTCPEDWPSKDHPPTATAEELKSQYIGSHHLHVSLLQPERFSNWKRLLRSTAFVLRFAHNLQSRRKGTRRATGELCQAELEVAERILFREAQFESFPEEISLLSAGRAISKSSPLATLCPYLDDNKILRGRGRLDYWQKSSPELKRPIILPRKHSTTILLVRDYHQRYHHQNHETVINEIRQRFCVPRLRMVLNAVRRSCQACKVATARPQPPLMGQLPPARLASFTRPFSFVGIDYFGPIYVCNLRRKEKRWGVLLTCLTIRAVHIEVASSLSTDSCILALRNFIARRGTPVEFFSDNGTNFHGAERELREAYQEVDAHTLMKTFTSVNTRWSFLPPAAPHMGGCWERLVRSVKTILYKIMPNRNPSDELLRSMLMEVESTINSRPLTYVPLNDENDEALTPNHFLLGSTSGSKPISILNDDKVVLKKNWLIAQQYANLFWKRWVNEYLPTITRRTKWFAPVKPIEVGDIVLIVDPSNPRNCWPKGRVIETRLSADGQVRRATVLTQAGVFERPAVKIAVLDIRDSSKVDPPANIPEGSVDIPGDGVISRGCHA